MVSERPNARCLSARITMSTSGGYAGPLGVVHVATAFGEPPAIHTGFLAGARAAIGEAEAAA